MTPDRKPHRFNCEMDQCHAALRDLGRAFTGKECIQVISDTAKVDWETAKTLLLVMNIMGYVEDLEEDSSGKTMYRAGGT